MYKGNNLMYRLNIRRRVNAPKHSIAYVLLQTIKRSNFIVSPGDRKDRKQFMSPYWNPMKIISL